ncbi:MAG: dTDP-4-dehydrorhamnose reductase [Bacteroidales bacterium]|nr:dTDP-4-dehydrorhamnose reductase [Bacteroidales bacterium]MCF8333032.1 dTDP-4-dehydrorhamnose reductase [Bacteroidales bacterium]
MKILITGANGQLGSEIKRIASAYPRHQFFFTDVDELDITQYSQVADYLEKNQIETLINCAAYTAVDKAEEEEKKAEVINGKAPGVLAQALKERGGKLIHVSTDYVFNGKTYHPYKEGDTPNPETAYGRTKLAGEKNIREQNPDAFIVRTAWLYSEYGKNFVKTMIRLGNEKNEIGVIYDQVGSPTYALNLAEAVLTLADIKTRGTSIYHYADEGVCSWYDMAVEIMRYKQFDCKVNALETHQYPTPARRPPYSVLNKSKIKNILANDIPHWRTSLLKCLENL